VIIFIQDVVWPFVRTMIMHHSYVFLCNSSNWFLNISGPSVFAVKARSNSCWRRSSCLSLALPRLEDSASRHLLLTQQATSVATVTLLGRSLIFIEKNVR